MDAGDVVLGGGEERLASGREDGVRRVRGGGERRLLHIVKVGWTRVRISQLRRERSI